MRRNGSIRIIELSSVRLQKPNKKVIFANCGRHDHCKARYKFEHTPGSMGSVYLKPHSEEQDHSNVERVARADAEHPVPRAHLDKGKALAAKRKTPLECHRELGPDVQKELPLRAVQNSFAKLRQKKQKMSVSEFADYLQSRKLDVNSCDSIPDGLWVLWYEVRTDYCAVMFFITELVRLVLDVWWFTYIWVIFRANVGKYAIPGAYGYMVVIVIHQLSW